MDSENMLTELDKDIVGLAVIDLLNHEVVYIPEKADYNAKIFNIHYYNKKAFYVYSYSDVKIDYTQESLDYEYINQHRFKKVFSYDLETGQETCIYEGQNIDIQDFYEDKACLKEESAGTCKVYCLDLVNGEKTLLLEDKDIDKYNVDGDRLIYNIYRSDNDSEYYYYDLTDKKTVPIGKLNNHVGIYTVMEDFIYVSFFKGDFA